jgi:hypothetical protein
MGANLSFIFAGTFSERVKKLVLIDGFGPVTKPPCHSPTLLRHAIDSESSFYTKRKDPFSVKLYDSVELAIQARIRTVQSYPGNQSLSYEAAAQLIAR